MATPRDIAASLIVDAPQDTTPAPAADEPQAEPAEVTTETTEDEFEEIQPNQDVGDEPDEDSEPEAAEDEPTQPDTDIESYTFKVEGEEVTATVEELITNYSIDGAARKRLQEATEAQKTAHEQGLAEGRQAAEKLVTERTQELDSMRQQFASVIQMVGQQLFASQMQPPDPAMEATDPIGYIQAKDRYRDEMERIQGLKQGITQAVAQQNEQLMEMKRQQQADQGVQLRQKRPDLVDREKAKEFTGYVRAAQNELGMSQEEVDNFPDHRGLLALELAGRYLAMQKGQGPTPAQKIVAKAKKPLTPGGVTYQRNAKQKQRRADRDRAKATGDYKDVAKLLITDAPPPRRR